MGSLKSKRSTKQAGPEGQGKGVSPCASDGESCAFQWEASLENNGALHVPGPPPIGLANVQAAQAAAVPRLTVIGVQFRRPQFVVDVAMRAQQGGFGVVIKSQ